MKSIKDFNIGQLSDGRLELAIVHDDKSVSVANIDADFVRAMLMTLMNIVAKSDSPVVKGLAQLLTIREVSGQIEHGLATLTYELEGLEGVSIQSTLPADSARALAQALATARTDPSSH